MKALQELMFYLDSRKSFDDYFPMKGLNELDLTSVNRMNLGRVLFKFCDMKTAILVALAKDARRYLLEKDLKQDKVEGYLTLLMVIENALLSDLFSVISQLETPLDKVKSKLLSELDPKKVKQCYEDNKVWIVGRPFPAEFSEYKQAIISEIKAVKQGMSPNQHLEDLKSASLILLADPDLQGPGLLAWFAQKNIPLDSAQINKEIALLGSLPEAMSKLLEELSTQLRLFTCIESGTRETREFCEVVVQQSKKQAQPTPPIYDEVSADNSDNSVNTDEDPFAFFNDDFDRLRLLRGKESPKTVEPNRDSTYDPNTPHF